MSMDEALVSADTEPEPPVAPQRTLALKLYELAVSLPIVAFIAVSMQHTPGRVQGPADPDLDRRDRRRRPDAGPDDDVERRVQPEFPDRAVRRAALSAARRGADRVARVERSARVPRSAAVPEGPVHPGADRGRRDLREPGVQACSALVGGDRQRYRGLPVRACGDRRDPCLDRRLRREPHLRCHLQLPCERREPLAIRAADPRRRVRRVPGGLHGARAFQRARGDGVPDVPGSCHPHLPGAAAVRPTDVPANALAAESDR